MKLRTVLLSILLLVFFHIESNSQDVLPSTLLWRISGKDLKKPSYMFGTMHLYDRRIFYFGDSLYNSLQNTEGFATEVDPTNLMDSLFASKNEDTLSQLRKMLNKRQEQLSDTAVEINSKSEKRSRRVLKRDQWIYKNRRKDDMNAIVDLYLFNIADKLGKVIGGLEDLKDQDLKDDIYDIKDDQQFMRESEKERKKHLNWMINVYVNENLQEISQWIAASGTDYLKNIILNRRNIKMAMNMDSLASVRPTFFAVGAAHLPGDSGLIALMKSRGYKVEPVFSSKRIAPEDYKFEAKSKPWLKVFAPDSSYAVDMPGKPSDLPSQNGVSFKMYADLGTSIFYMSGSGALSSTADTAKLFEDIKGRFGLQGFKNSNHKNINLGSVKGISFTSLQNNIFYSFRIYLTAGKQYYSVVGAQKKEHTEGSEAQSFFNSFQILRSKSIEEKVWVQLREKEKGFSAYFPGHPQIDILKPEEVGENWSTIIYSLIDYSTENYLMLVINETAPGYFIPNDSIMFDERIQVYKTQGLNISYQRFENENGNNVAEFRGDLEKDNSTALLRIKMINRGNRNYSLLSISSKEKLDSQKVNKFFDSFRLEKFQEADWAIKDLPGVYKTSVPSDIRTDTSNSGKDERMVYYSYDPNSSTTYNITSQKIPEYYWTDHDSSYFKELAKGYYTDTSSEMAISGGAYDSLIYILDIINGSVRGKEYFVKMAGTGNYKLIRLLINADSIYELSSIGAYEVQKSNVSYQFFKNFRFVNEQIPVSLYQNKTDAILRDIVSADSLIREKAIIALRDAEFKKEDYASLQEAYLKNYQPDSTDYMTLYERIADRLYEAKDSAQISFVEKNYNSAPALNSSAKMEMLTMLAGLQTKSSVLVIKELLKQNLPSNGAPYQFFNALLDSALLTQLLFPIDPRLYSDSILGPGFIYLTNRFSDSLLINDSLTYDQKHSILKLAEYQYNVFMDNENVYPYYNDDVIKILARINTSDAQSILYNYISVKDPYIKISVVEAMSKAGYKIPEKELLFLASMDETRISLYHTLSKSNKTNLFPVKYYTQEFFAKSFLYEYITDDDNESDYTISIIEQKTVLNKGKSEKYFIARIENSESNILGICGPFEVNKKLINSDYDKISMATYYVEKFSREEIKSKFEEFIASQSE